MVFGGGRTRRTAGFGGSDGRWTAATGQAGGGYGGGPRRGLTAGSGGRAQFGAMVRVRWSGKGGDGCCSSMISSGDRERGGCSDLSRIGSCCQQSPTPVAKRMCTQILSRVEISSNCMIEGSHKDAAAVEKRRKRPGGARLTRG